MGVFMWEFFLHGLLLGMSPTPFFLCVKFLRESKGKVFPLALFLLDF